MNKQELINELAKYVKRYENAIDDYSQGRRGAYKVSLKLAKQLDEPQKPKTEVFNHDEKFVVEWLDHTTGYHYSLYNAINDAGSEVRSWMKIGFNSNKFARAFMSMDYEVEKEPLYCVIINGGYLVKVFSNTNVVILVPADEISQYVAQKFQLTEKQIKAIDERYWAFAVPVDEVEG